MVAEAKDQKEGATSPDGLFLVSSQMESVSGQSKSLLPNGNGYTPKARKPYIITKQRERWTAEEHQKFVEALKLYGRAWRQIEEHVGTKTAIQIRSHAQKFFAKLTRESNIDAEGKGNLDPIEIPPPRPKKKPLHPYPRKMVDSTNTEISHSPDGSAPERENLSPTSVLSVIDTDTLESTVAEVHKSCLSPASCATDTHSAYSFNERDNEHPTSKIDANEEIGFCLPVKTSSASVPDDKSTMKLKLFRQEAECCNDSPYAEEPYTSIKLFGKTVTVTKTPKWSLKVVENCRASPPENLLCYMDNMFSLPWWTWHPGAANLSLYSSCKETDTGNTDYSPLKEEVKNEEFQPEGSWVGPNGSTSEIKAESQNNDAFEAKHVTNTGRKESAKGFVAYKRCLAERDGKSSISCLQEREGQRARVCS